MSTVCHFLTLALSLSLRVFVFEWVAVVLDCRDGQTKGYQHPWRWPIAFIGDDSQEEHAIAERLDDSQKLDKKQRRGPLFVPSFVDIALLPVDGEEAVVGYCAWSSEPWGSSENCIHIMNLAVALEFRSCSWWVVQVVGEGFMVIQWVERRGERCGECAIQAPRSLLSMAASCQVPCSTTHPRKTGYQKLVAVSSPWLQEVGSCQGLVETRGDHRPGKVPL
eukprot:Skav233994  [mRNA]  locus=scaffold2413:66955:68598:+ [translate_table: standard]